MITKQQIDEWRALCEAATEAPWEIERDEDGVGETLEYPSTVGPFSWCEHAGETVEQIEADVAFIKAARVALPSLLDEVERLWETVLSLRQSRVRLRRAMDAAADEIERLEQKVKLFNNVGLAKQGGEIDAELECGALRGEADRLRAELSEARATCADLKEDMAELTRDAREQIQEAHDISRSREE